MTLTIILILAITAIGIFLGYHLLCSLKIIEQLRADRNELLEQRAKQSDRLREKGIEIDGLKKEIKRLGKGRIA